MPESVRSASRRQQPTGCRQSNACLLASVYHLSIKPISRSDGRTATAAAAYRSAELIIDERTGEVHDYTAKGDVVHSELVLPAGAPAWAGDRAALWNAAEAAEKRKDARVARDYEVAIPKELTREQGIELVRDFAQALVDRYGVAIDFNVHRDDLRAWDGSEKGWQGYHAHVLASTRKLGREGFGEKAAIELSDTKRKSLGLANGAAEIEQIRQLWEVAANRHLEQAGVLQRIDRRSLKDQGIDRDPTVHLGPRVVALERDGKPSRLGDLNRKAVAEHQMRVEDQRVRDTLLAEIIEIYEKIVERGERRGDTRAEREQDEQAPHRLDRLNQHERAAIRAGMWELVRQRDLRVARVLVRAQEREERRDKAYQAIARAEPAAPKGLLDAFQQKAHEQALAAWQVSKDAAAKLVEQAKRLATRLLELAEPQRLAAWAHDHLRRVRPDLVQGRASAIAAEQGRQQAGSENLVRETELQRPAPSRPSERHIASPEATPPGQAVPKPVRPNRTLLEAATPNAPEPGVGLPVAPPKRDWNRYKALQQELADKGRQSLQERGVLKNERDGPSRDGPDRDPPELKRELTRERSRSRGPRR